MAAKLAGGSLMRVWVSRRKQEIADMFRAAAYGKLTWPVDRHIKTYIVIITVISIVAILITTITSGTIIRFPYCKHQLWK